MWYSSYRFWELRNKKIPFPNYEIRYATSINGIDWKFYNKKIIGSKKLEAIARPYVVKRKIFYEMWYCARSKNNNYSINYAISKNDIKWKKERFKLKLSKKGYDSDMQAYPCYFTINKKEYLLYNGNGYGKDGILMATKELK